MRMSPGARITLLVGIVVLVTMLCSLGALLTAREMERLMGTMVSKHLPSVEAAAELENALLQQRGLVAIYMLDDGQLAWINDLDKIKPSLTRWLAEAKHTARTNEERDLLTLLTEVYASYDEEREHAIALYHSGHTREARDLLLGDVSRLSDQTYGLCRQLVAANERSMNLSLAATHRRVRDLTFALAAGAVTAILLSMGVLLIVYRRFLRPVRRLARDARSFSDFPGAGGHSPHHSTGTPARAPFADEFDELDFYSRVIMSEMERARSTLEASQQRLMTAEKLAAVGKFAAIATHEIRSPLCSIRIRLYDLKQSAGDRNRVERDCQILEDEVRRLEDLATSYLQYSRPLDVQLVRQDLTAIVASTLEGARLDVERRGRRLVHVNGHALPAILGDADKLRQVLLNLIQNAAEATPEGGEVRVIECFETGSDGRTEVLVRIEDNGPGIADAVRDQLFEPFRSTKPHGAGLGLSIASGIVDCHGGRLALESSTPLGTVFAVRLPACVD